MENEAYLASDYHTYFSSRYGSIAYDNITYQKFFSDLQEGQEFPNLHIQLTSYSQCPDNLELKPIVNKHGEVFYYTSQIVQEYVADNHYNKTLNAIEPYEVYHEDERSVLMNVGSPHDELEIEF